jgi:hypothetical protein
MKQADVDQDIRELFQDARRAEEAWTPSFDRVVGPVARRRSRARFAVVLAGVAAAVVVAVAVRGVTSAGESAVSLGIPLGSLTMPTDFLLDTPGAEILRSVPSIGTGTWSLWPERPKGRSQ